MVAATVNRLLGSKPAAEMAAPTHPTPAPSSRKRLIYQDEIRAIAPGGELRVAPGSHLTPLAQEAALQQKVRIVYSAPTPAATPVSQRSIALGADHGGFALKESLRKFLEESGYKVTDVGTSSTEAVDYPDFAFAVAKLVADGQAWRGIMIDGAGIGSCMVANKVPGVRASMCYDLSSASNAREHNDANLLTLGASLIGPHLAQQIVKTWLSTEFGGGRHARRVNKIADVERRFARA